MTPLRQILGVAITTLRESFRSRLLWVIGLFGFLVLAAIPLFPAVGPEEKAKFILTWSLAAATAVGGLSIIFLVAPTASRELEEKTLQQVLVKPVGRLAYCAGRVLGFGGVSLLLFLGMGLLCFAGLASGAAGDLSGAPFLDPSRLVDADRVEVIGQLKPSKDWEVKRWLPPGGRIVYRFSGLGEKGYPAEDTEILASLPGSLTADFPSLCQAALHLENLYNGKEWRGNVLLGHEEKRLKIDPELLRGGDLRATLYPDGGALGIGERKRPEDLGIRFRIRGRGSSFETVLIAFFLMGLGVFLLAGAVFLFSVWISGKLALVMALVVFSAGLSPTYLEVMGRILRGEIQLETSEHHPHGSGIRGEAEKAGPASPVFSILAVAADGLALVLPDIDRFGAGIDLVAGYSYGMRRIFRLMVYLGGYLLLSLLLSGLAFRIRELA